MQSKIPTKAVICYRIYNNFYLDFISIGKKEYNDLKIYNKYIKNIKEYERKIEQLTYIEWEIDHNKEDIDYINSLIHNKFKLDEELEKYRSKNKIKIDIELTEFEEKIKELCEYICENEENMDKYPEIKIYIIYYLQKKI